MPDIRQRYPSTSTTAITITLASLASDTNLLNGRESTAVSNTTDTDLDHLVSGRITVGTSPTSGRVIEVWGYAYRTIASGTPTYPTGFTGSDAAENIASANLKNSMLRLLWSTTTDATSDRTYEMPPTSVRQAFGNMPAFWGIWVVHSTGVNLNSTAGNHEFVYHRIQAQTV